MVRLRYGSKDALLEALFASIWLPRFIIEPPPGADGLTRVLAPVDHIIDVLRTDPGEFKAFVTVSFETPGHISDLKPRYVECWQRYEQQTVESLVAGQQDGSVRMGIDLSREAQHALTYGTGLCYRWSMDWDGYDIVGALTSWRASIRRNLGT